MLKIIFWSNSCGRLYNNHGLKSEQLGSEGCLLGPSLLMNSHHFCFEALCCSIPCPWPPRRADGSHCCYLERAVITANPPSKVFPQDNYCFGDSSCRPCPSLFAQNILLPAIFLGQARATHVISSWACKQDKDGLKGQPVLGWPPSALPWWLCVTPEGTPSHGGGVGLLR